MVNADASVPLSKESSITNTLQAYLVALLLMRVGGCITFSWLASFIMSVTQCAFHSPVPEHRACFEGTLQRMGEGSSFCLKPR